MKLIFIVMPFQLIYLLLFIQFIKKTNAFEKIIKPIVLFNFICFLLHSFIQFLNIDNPFILLHNYFGQLILLQLMFYLLERGLKKDNYLKIIWYEIKPLRFYFENDGSLQNNKTSKGLLTILTIIIPCVLLMILYCLSPNFWMNLPNMVKPFIH